MTNQITLQLDISTNTLGNAEEIAEMVICDEWRISGDYLVLVDPSQPFKYFNKEETVCYASTSGENKVPNGWTVEFVSEQDTKGVDSEGGSIGCYNGSVNSIDAAELCLKVLSTEKADSKLLEKANSKLSKLLDSIIPE